MRTGFNIGDRVLHNSKEGIIKGFDPYNRAMASVWFDEAGQDTKVLNVATLKRK